MNIPDKDIDKISRLLKNDKQDKILLYMKCKKRVFIK